MQKVTPGENDLFPIGESGNRNKLSQKIELIGPEDKTSAWQRFFSVLHGADFMESPALRELRGETGVCAAGKRQRCNASGDVRGREIEGSRHPLGAGYPDISVHSRCAGCARQVGSYKGANCFKRQLIRQSAKQGFFDLGL